MIEVEMQNKALEALGKILPTTEIDMVNHPPHYQGDGVECIDAIRSALGLSGFIAYCKGNAIKYCWRQGRKDLNSAAQDLEKAAWYLERAAEELRGQ